MSDNASSIARPRRLGKYEILSKIGDGGMASVYRARHYADLAGPARAIKEVALKVIHPHLSGDHDFTLMFLDEVRIAMAMSHRNIVQTFDAGQDGEQHFMVMELVRGCSLRAVFARAARGGAPLDIALFVATELCAALEYAHGFSPSEESAPGVVHRDVSPSNILLSAQGEVKLADFGVAKAAGRLHVSSADLIKGKLSYMAPEQARGEVEPRSDIFALGAVLYRLVCGRPFRERPDLDSARWVGQIEPPSAFRDEVSPALDAAILSCLAGDPNGRPHSASELREILGHEAFSLQMRLGGSRDMHSELRGYLEGHGLLGSTEQGSTAPRGEGEANRIAEAMLAGALEVPTDHGERSTTFDDPSFFDEGATTIDQRQVEESEKPGERDEDRPEKAEEGQAIVEGTAIITGGGSVESVRPAHGTSPGGGRRRWLLVAASFFVVGSSVGGWLWLGAAPPPSPLTERDSTTVAPDRGVLAVATPKAATDAGLAPRWRADAAGDLAFAHGAPPVDLATREARRRPRRAAIRSRALRAFGNVDINAIPWAKVYIDGKFRGVTPVQGVRLRAGRHRLRLVNEKWKLSRRLTITIVAKQHLRRVFELSP